MKNKLIVLAVVLLSSIQVVLFFGYSSGRLRRGVLQEGRASSSSSSSIAVRPFPSLDRLLKEKEKQGSRATWSENENLLLLSEINTTASGVCGSRKCFFPSAAAPDMGWLVADNRYATTPYKSYHYRYNMSAAMDDSWTIARSIQQEYGAIHFYASPPRRLQGLEYHVKDAFFQNRWSSKGYRRKAEEEYDLIVQLVKRAPMEKLYLFRVTKHDEPHRLTRDILDYARQNATVSQAQFAQEFVKHVDDNIAILRKFPHLKCDFQVLVGPTGTIYQLDLDRRCKKSSDKDDTLVEKYLQVIKEKMLLHANSMDLNTHSHFAKLEQLLQQSTTQYYMYNIHDLVSPEISRKLNNTIRQLDQGGECPLVNAYCSDMESEVFLLDGLARHKQRCHGDACSRNMIHVISIPVNALLAVDCPMDCSDMGRLKDCAQRKEYVKPGNPVHQALIQLQKHSRFQYGHRHVLFTMRCKFFRDDKYYNRGGRFYGPLLYNVTLANDNDPIAVRQMLAENRAYEFSDSFKAKRLNITRSNMVLGLGLGGLLPLQPVNLAEWKARPYFVFYRTRKEGSIAGSTPYRRALLKREIDWNQFPQSSVGHDLPEDEWKDTFVKSKFCPVIRGDSPHSHSLLRSVRVGCIPVVISDLYQDYAGPFKSFLKIADFGIMVDEKPFLKDPESLLVMLQNLSPTEINEKLQGLAFAQKVLFHDHPESLFVQAFLRDAEHSMKQFGVY